MKVVVGSKNPVKVAAVQEVFEALFDDVEVIGVAVTSGVSDQPFDDDIFRGAKNRAKGALTEYSDADFSIGVEGGVTWYKKTLMAFNVSVVLHRDGRESVGTSGMFELPPVVADGIKSGKELGIVMDEVFGTNNLKHKEGAVGVFTKNYVTRKDFCVNSLHLAMARFNHPELFE